MVKLNVGTYATGSTAVYVVSGARSEAGKDVITVIEYPPLPLLRSVVDYGPKNAGTHAVLEIVNSVGEKTVIFHGPHSPICDSAEMCATPEHDMGHVFAVAEAVRYAKQEYSKVLGVNYHAPYCCTEDEELIQKMAHTVKLLKKTAGDVEVTIEPQWYPRALEPEEVLEAVRMAEVRGVGLSLQLENEIIRDFWPVLLDLRLAIPQLEQRFEHIAGKSLVDYWKQKFAKLFASANSQEISPVVRYACIIPYTAFGDTIIYKKRAGYEELVEGKCGPSIEPIVEGLFRALKEVKPKNDIYFIYTGFGIDHHSRHYNYRLDAEMRGKAVGYIYNVIRSVALKHVSRRP
jgi:hypothetical protein